jgi:sterol desaturase/sphingolipid hydroxylase (fatty acid hydroxylase superfamily)
MSVTAWRQFTPLYFYTVVALCLGYLAAGEGFSSWSILLLLGAGFLSWSLIEYGLHRFIFHYDAQSRLGRKLLYHAHLSHHESPEATNRIFASLYLSVPIAAAYWLLAWVTIGSSAVASYLFIGMAAGYFFYEWLHFQCHHGRSRLWLLRYLRKYHLLHHHKTPELRFGVTSPFFDVLFGTFRPVVNRRQ